MSLAFWIALVFVIFAVGDLLFAYAVSKKIRNLIAIHKLELKIAKDDILRTLPLVQHCNQKTNYEMIVHRWCPDKCEHCKEILDLLEA
jgi:hypothetical protein